MEASEKALKTILLRLEKLESAVFGGEKTKPRSTKRYQGPSGGVRLLIESNYFEKRRTAAEVHGALQEKGYIYKREVVQVALYRLSKKNGFLVVFEDRGTKVYANRK